MRIFASLVLLALASPVFSQIVNKRKGGFSESDLIGFYLEAIQNVSPQNETNNVCYLFEIYQKIVYLEDYITGQKSNRLKKAGVSPESLKILRLHFARRIAVDFGDRMRSGNTLDNSCLLRFNGAGSILGRSYTVYEIGDILDRLVVQNPEISDQINLRMFSTGFVLSVLKNIGFIKAECKYYIENRENFRVYTPCRVLANAMRFGVLPSKLGISQEMAKKISAILD